VAQPVVVQRSPVDEGPLGALIKVTLGAVVTILGSWMFSIVIELVGMHYFWPERGLGHARDLVIEDLGYIADAPHSVFVPETVPFATWLVQNVARPFVYFDLPNRYQAGLERQALMAQRAASGSGAAGQGESPSRREVVQTLAENSLHFLVTIGMAAMYTAQDSVLRLAVVVFALPAFLLACLLGAVDGLVRRDLRKWNGGRESSFVYHHAKATVYLAMGFGLGLYLSWPFGGFNPSYVVLTGTVMVAWSLSLTLSAFKKYL